MLTVCVSQDRHRVVSENFERFPCANLFANFFRNYIVPTFIEVHKLMINYNVY